MRLPRAVLAFAVLLTPFPCVPFPGAGFPGAPVPAAAQDAAPVAPGGVVTRVAAARARPGDTLRYAFELRPGVRSFGPATGVVVADSSGRARVALTLGLPADAPAGPLSLGTLAFEGGAAPGSTELEVTVAARREMTLHLSGDTVAVPPAGLVELPFRVHNRGNTTDTALIEVEGPTGWEWHVNPERVALEPGQVVTGTVQLVPPERATPGGEHRLRVRLSSAGIRRSASVTATVVGREPVIEGLAQLPGSIFIGSSSRDGGEPGVALQADGRLGGGTRLSLAVRHSPSLVPPTAFRSELSGPRIRLQVESERFQATAGDVFLAGDVFTGPVQQGRGGEIGVRSGRLSADLLVARPWSYAAAMQQGHLARLQSEVATPAGRFGIQLASIDRSADLLPGYGSTGGGVTYGLRRGQQRLEAAAGVVRVSDGDAHRSGFAGSARYRAQWKSAAITTSLRTVPATTRRATSHGREAFVSGFLGLVPGLALTGWGYARSAPLLDDAPHPVSRGAAAGFQITFPREVRLDLTGGIRRADLVGDTIAADRTRSARARLDVPVGPSAYLEADVDVGRVRGGQSRAYGNYRLGLRWHAPSQWAWIGVSRYDGGLGDPDTRLDLAGAVQLRSVRLQGGFNVPFQRNIPDRLSLWSGIELPLNRDYDLLAGLDYTGARDEPTRLSLGVRRRIGLPLPLPRRPVLQGVVFEDRNGDGLRDTGEPPLSGIEVRLGALRTTTDAQGAFEFHEHSEGPLRIPASALPFNAMVPPGIYLPTRGAVDIPVIRTASLRLEIFFDRDGDSVRDDAEGPAAGAVVSLVDTRGRSRSATTTDQGRVRFGTVEQGAYTLRVARPDGTVFETQLRAGPGELLERVIAVPLRSREIRLQSGRMETPHPDSPSTTRESAERAESRSAAGRPASTVLFEFDSDRLRPEALEMLRDVWQESAVDSGAVLVLTGHTDAIGAAEYNLALSKKRAEAIASALRDAGVPASRIQVRAAGENRPVADNASVEGRRQNRRVEIRLERSARD